ncbi:MAG: TIGR03619 family F420-dependent LLM class oxidoreductase [Acetobacteraceae bacterium]|nr:TIGR03619 family F420-dependent LLM class oxidoreductase [Acetobacteraceae bacterium]
MQFGFNAPTAGALAVPDALLRTVTEGEAMGFDYATISDHVVIPKDIEARYPYTDSGEFPAGARQERHEQLIETAWLAAHTKRLRLVLSVMVVPHRPAVLAAKQLASIDVLSGGRLTVGIGAGWMREEFEALQTEPFDERGAVTDDYLRAFKTLWTEDDPRHEGKYTRFSNIDFSPKPVQRPHPPLWVGGESGPAMRRTAALGDAWYPIQANPAIPMDSLKRLTAGIEKLRGLVAKAGRDPKAVGVVVRVQATGEGVPAKAGDGERRMWSGSTADVIQDLRDLRALGVQSCDFGFPGRTPDEVLGAMKRFADTVISKV